MHSRHLTCTLVVLLIGAMMAAAPGLDAQTSGQQPAPKAGGGGQPKSPPKGAAAAPSAEGGLGRRIEQLEEQLVDMQVVIGTLESLARGGGQGGGRPAASGGGGGGGLSPGEAGRLDGLETQIRALAAQMERLSEQVSRLEGGGGPAPAPRPGKQGGGFGSTVIVPDQDQIGNVIKGQGPQQGQQSGGGGATAQYTNPRQLFEVAYGHLLQQEYGPAEAAFSDFLQRYPNDNLAGSAQYWLGETHFVRGQYQAAARSFLKGYQTYRASNKAPDSLLKLAMSLEMLGQRNDACATFAELATRFPQAPSHVRNRASAERQRLACS